MFSLTHIIWLLICACIITVLTILAKKNILNYKISMNITLITMLISQASLVMLEIQQRVDGDVVGYYVPITSLPMHLCSLQIFFVIATKLVTNEEKRAKLESFMGVTMILGGIMAILFQTEGSSFARFRVYEYFTFHAVIIYYGIYLIFIKKVDMGMKAYIRTIVMMIGLLFVSLWLNSIFSNGPTSTNYLYVARPPLQGIPFFTLKYGWHVYFIHLSLTGIILMTGFHLPFIILEKKHQKANNKEAEA